MYFIVGPKKILFVSDFRAALSNHVRPKFILCIFKKKKNNNVFIFYLFRKSIS